jgi:hypothetical protein
MAQAGITHQDNKGIQTKIEELQTSYSKGSDFLRNAGSGLQDKDIDNGTTTLNGKLPCDIIEFYFPLKLPCPSRLDQDM